MIKGIVVMMKSLPISIRQFFAICFLLLFAAGPVMAGSLIAAVNTEQGLAIKGYDPVTYFSNGKPTPGLAQFSFTYNGAVYRFASTANRDSFLAAPDKFLPQYGGYCAYAIALNTIADIDPDEWKIVNGKLYLNNNFLSQTLWSLDKPGYIAKGDQNWPRVPKLAGR
jgi:YHS domain-containing protein